MLHRDVMDDMLERRSMEFAVVAEESGVGVKQFNGSELPLIP